MSDTEEKNDNRHNEEEAVPTASFSPGVARPGGQIGPYKLLSILGDGGCGTVYLKRTSNFTFTPDLIL